MSEEDDVVQPEEVQLTEAQKRAVEQGWKPKEEWEGDPDDWVDYREFNFRGELMDRIRRESSNNRQLSSQVNALEKALKTLGEHNKKIAEREYNRAMADMKAQYREAVREGNEDIAVTLEERMEELKGTYEEVTKGDNTATPSNNDPAVKKPTEEEVKTFNTWAEKNTWYNSDDNNAMAGAADRFALTYKRKNPDATLEQVLEHVDKRIHEEFPHKFNNPAKERPSAVAEQRTYAAKPKVAKKFTSKDLSDDQKQFGKTFVQAGVFKDLQEYVDQLAELKELPSQKGE